MAVLQSFDLLKQWKLDDKDSYSVLAASLLILLLLCNVNEQIFQFLFYCKGCHLLSQHKTVTA